MTVVIPKPSFGTHGIHTFYSRQYLYANYQQTSYHRYGFRYSRRIARTYTYFSHGLWVIMVKASDRKLNRGLWENFHKQPLPCNVTIRMLRGDFKKLLPWLRYDFATWTVEAVPESGENQQGQDSPIEYKVGFQTEKECAVFLLFKDEVLSGDLLPSIPEPPKRVRKKSTK